MFKKIFNHITYLLSELKQKVTLGIKKMSFSQSDQEHAEHKTAELLKYMK